jgi:hypothetical protein
MADSQDPLLTLETLLTRLRTLEHTLQQQYSTLPTVSNGVAPMPGSATSSAPVRLSPAERRRRQALEQDLLTERGWREGYEVLQPSRWMSRFWSDLLFLNTALQRLETNSFTLLGGSAAFPTHARAFYQRLADYRAFTDALAREALRLARGRFGSDMPQDVPPASPQRNDAPVPSSHTPEAEAVALQGPTLAELRARAMQEQP